MVKLLSVRHVVTFITLFSVLVLLGCARVDSLEQDNKLYEEYINEKYETLEHFQKQEQARNFVYSRDYQNIAPKFDII